MTRERARYAPSTTGAAHPGTLLAGLLVWLDARRAGAHLRLRLENLDTTRSSAALVTAMEGDLAWIGLHWDAVDHQDQLAHQHGAALDQLAAAGALYPCGCSRAERKASGRRAPDGGWAYDNRCRGRALPAGGWRACREPLRAALPAGRIELRDASGLDLSQDPAHEMGDPVVVRRDGAVAYHLAVVVDDAAAGITRVVRGRDLATSTATQVALQRLLGLPTPSYRHHFLLLEPRGGKLSKLHGSVGAPALRARYGPDELVRHLARAAGLHASPTPCTPQSLLARFDWARVRQADRELTWDGSDLRLGA